MPTIHKLFIAAAISTLAWPLISTRPVCARESHRPPNFLVVLMDNIGQDWFGCYGSQEGQTPNIDRLATEGVRFQTCYAVPLCSTSRHVFLTGRYPFRTGWTIHHDAAIYGGGYFDWNRETCFARILRSAGYATALAGKWQMNNLFETPDALEKHGFQEHCVFPEGPRGHPAHIKRYWDPYILLNGDRRPSSGDFGPDVFTEFLMDFMRRHRDEPFLAFYPMVFTHLPATTTPLQADDDLSEHRKLAGMVRYADHCIGRLIAAIEEMELRDNTIVLLTTDNGTPAEYGGRVTGRVFQAAASTMVEGDMKEGSIAVPFIANCPNLIPGNRASSALIDASDLLPTLVDLAGVSLPADLAVDGRSFADLLRETPRAAQRDWILSQYADMRVLRNQRYKLRSDGRFHDLQADPLERHDLSTSQDPRHVAAKGQLQEVLDTFPPNAECWFTPRSISARRLGVGNSDQRNSDSTRAPDDPPPAVPK